MRLHATGIGEGRPKGGVRRTEAKRSLAEPGRRPNYNLYLTHRWYVDFYVYLLLLKEAGDPVWTPTELEEFACRCIWKLNESEL